MGRFAARTVSRRRLAVIGLAIWALLLSACTGPGKDGSGRPANVPDAAPVLAAVAAALSSGDFSTVPVTGAREYPAQDYAAITKLMGTAKPTVTALRVTYGTSTTAEGTLQVSWPLFPTPWVYETKASLNLDAGQWRFVYAPTSVHPAISSASRLARTRLLPQRGSIIGNNNIPLVTLRDVIRVGIDKSKLTDPAQQERSARALAKLVSVDEAAYVKQVADAGPQQFVVAIVLRGAVGPSELGDIPGALAQSDKMMLGPSKTFASPVLGALGPATAEMIAAANGALESGDEVGLSGLQAAQEATLRGAPGYRIRAVAREQSASATPSADPSPSSPPETLPATLTTVEQRNGTDVRVTLDSDWQTKAEAAIASAGQPSAIAVVQPSTGRVLALAVSPNANGQAMANWGHYPPGSTFKIISSLALLRSGLTPDSPVNCSVTANVDGSEINNRPGFPTAYNGMIPLREAVAQSCNTAFINATRPLPDTAFAQAAASLGVGVDFDTGFTAFYGSVPTPKNAVAKAEQSFGQGTIEASPLAIAGMSASVAAGKTVVPWLVEGHQPQPTAAALTAGEAEALRSMMAGVVATAPSMLSMLAGAKTGTAEFGPANDVRNHIWLTGFTTSDVAITAFSELGGYGSDLAGPIRAALG